MRNSIKEIVEKIKLFYTSLPLEVLFALIVILVGFASFGLGRLSAIEEAREPARLMYNNVLSIEPNINVNGKVVVSKNGTKYHYPWCSGSSRMKDTNKRWYDSIEEARAAGYSPASNCKGLK